MLSVKISVCYTEWGMEIPWILFIIHIVHLQIYNQIGFSILLSYIL